MRGRVQGVGFRPFVWRLAEEAGLVGRVLNDGAGVTIDIWGLVAELEAFQDRLQRDQPPLAQVESVQWTPLDSPAPNGPFHIDPSRAGAVSTEIAPDAATCPACLAEVMDPADRRYRYAFTNCTHCGPRLSIITGVPYDRAATSMRGFTMCADCQREYDDPADRRFHAQPNACPACGPRVWLEDKDGMVICEDPIAEAVLRLGAGAIIAIKGLGGVHLACDAENANAVAELRRRKHRAAKPLAIMVRDIGQARHYCHLSEAEVDLLASPAAPIVLLETRSPALSGIAPGQSRTGVMLPYAPLHHLLMMALDGPLVMTSGNASGLPQVTTNLAARMDLAGIADAWLLHDRDIVNRLDDTVARVDPGAPVVLRRARGVAPGSVPLAQEFAAAPATLALGAELKSTFCLLRDARATVSQHIGDLKAAETFADFRGMVALFRDLFRFDPEVIAVDLHPDYLSTAFGRALAVETGARLVAVQHHHAHLAACLAEHRIAPDDGPSVGIIMDGTGLGTDRTIWGGEILLGGYGGFERKAHLEPVALPGGDQATRQPWRNTVAQLQAAFGPDWRAHLAGTPLMDRLTSKPLALISQMIARQVNAPLAASAGRLFDAVAAALGIAFDQQHYEGQAAMELEAAALPYLVTAGAYPVAVSAGGVISWGPMWTALLSDLRAGMDPGVIAARFHNGLAAVLAQVAGDIATGAGTRRITLSGGVMQNRALVQTLGAQLSSRGFQVLLPRRIPANDGGVSLGQAAVAAFS